MFQALAAEYPAVPEYRRDLAISHRWVGIVLERPAIWPGPSPSSGVPGLTRALAAEHPEVPDYRRELAVSHNRVGVLLEQTGDLAGRWPSPEVP